MNSRNDRVVLWLQGSIKASLRRAYVCACVKGMLHSVFVVFRGLFSVHDTYLAPASTWQCFGVMYGYVV